MYVTAICQEFLTIIENCPNRLKRRINTVTIYKVNEMLIFILFTIFAPSTRVEICLVYLWYILNRVLYYCDGEIADGNSC